MIISFNNEKDNIMIIGTKYDNKKPVFNWGNIWENEIIKKYKFEKSENCSNKNNGKNVNNEYFLIE